MTPSVDHSPPRRPIFFPVVIATVFLTIIGMTGGFMLGERHRRLIAATESSGPAGTTQPTPGPSTWVSTAATPSALPPTARDDGVPCPDLTRKTAANLGFSSQLRQVLKIETLNGTTVWICQDDTGGYFYQGKTGGVGAPLVEGKNGLFLSKVHHAEDREEYVAVADNGNRIVVNRKQLEIHFANGSPTQVNPAVRSE